MTKNESNIFAMYDSVEAVLETNSTQIDTIPAMGDAKARFSADLDEIRLKDNEYSSLTDGKTTTKKNKEDAMIDGLMPIISAMLAYAAINNDEELKETVAYSEWRLKRLRDESLLNRANLIFAKATDLGESLGNFGVTAEKLTELRGLIDAYDGSMNTQESSFAEKRAARQALSELFDKADAILKDELDKLIELFKSSDVDFYNEYMSARVIKDLGIHHNSASEQAEY